MERRRMRAARTTRCGALARDTAAAVARGRYRKLVARLSARTRDVAGAEDALSAAFVAALVDWPEKGLPDDPEAWLLAVARRKGIDAARRRRRADEAAGHLRELARAAQAAADAGGEPDARSALARVCAHPAIEPGLRAPLVLQALLGLGAAEIARAYRIPPAAMSQRLVRAKRRIRESGPPDAVPGALPDRRELEARTEALLESLSAVLARTGRAPCPSATGRLS